MKKLLYISVNSKPEDLSASKTVARKFINKFLQKNKDFQVEEIDLYKEHIHRLEYQYFEKRNCIVNEDDAKKLNDKDQKEVQRIRALCDQFISANVYVIAAPMWSLSFPAPFKEKLSLSDCKLKTIEKYLGIYREDTISGKESIDLYKEYYVSQDIDLKEKILLHNYEDIYYLGIIFKIKDILKGKLNVLCISINNLSLELVPISFKISKNTLSIKYIAFEGNISNINIYSDSYSIISDENNITLDILLNKGTDSNNNIILFYNLSKIIPLKFNDLYLEDNIYSLCNYILKKELSSL